MKIEILVAEESSEFSNWLLWNLRPKLWNKDVAISKKCGLRQAKFPHFSMGEWYTLSGCYENYTEVIHIWVISLKIWNNMSVWMMGLKCKVENNHMEIFEHLCTFKEIFRYLFHIDLIAVYSKNKLNRSRQLRNMKK